MTWFRHFSKAGFAVIADWIILTQMWSEAKKEEGMAINKILIERCDLLVQVGPSLSTGMIHEERMAREAGIPVVNLIGLPYGDAITRLCETPE